MNPGLTFAASASGRVQVIRLNGFLDGHTSTELERRLAEVVKAGHHRLVLDLSNLTYIASAGVGVLISVQHTVKNAGGGLHLVNPTPNVREIFSILGLTSVLSIHESLEAGVHAAAG